MRDQLEKIRNDAIELLKSVGTQAELETARIKFLGKKGELTAVLKQMGRLSPEERPVMGQIANEVLLEIE